MQAIGVLAGLATSVCWSGSSVLFTFAGRRMGSAALNHLRMWIATVLLILIHLVMFQTPFPVDAGGRRIVLLVISGILGYSVGDSLLLEAFVLIGPRISMLLMTLSPAFGALLAWIFLGEQPSVLQIAGIAITIAGIAIVVSKRPASEETRPKGYFGGILLAFAAALGQSGAFLLSKIAMTGEYSAFSANLIRISAATVCLAILALLRGTFVAHIRKLADRKAALLTSTATMIGPVTGVALALYTINHTLVGIGTTLIALPPIFLIPISRIVFGERISPRAILGSLISVAGIVLMVLPSK